MKGFPLMGAAVAAVLASRGTYFQPTQSFDGLKTYGLMGNDTRIPFGSSKWSVAKDKRRAMKRRAVKRARRLGHA